MRSSFLFLLLCCPSHATPCTDCCRSGGNCSSAFKGHEGVCCGSDAWGAHQCCPAQYRCVACETTYRCAAPFENVECRDEDATVVQALFFLFLCSFCVLICFRFTRQSPPPRASSIPVAVPVNGVVVPPPPRESVVPAFATGLLAGMVIDEVLEDDPPSYVESTAGSAPDS